MDFQGGCTELGVEIMLRMIGDRVPRKIFGPKREEVRGEWRKLHNEELHNFYSLPSIIRAIKSAGLDLREWGSRPGASAKQK
jgi:hypothetical protein